MFLHGHVATTGNGVFAGGDPTAMSSLYMFQRLLFGQMRVDCRIGHLEAGACVYTLSASGDVQDRQADEDNSFIRLASERDPAEGLKARLVQDPQAMRIILISVSKQIQ
jgi:hypothetical protein